MQSLHVSQIELDGFWTYLVPGTVRGGIACIKDGLIVGGDDQALFNGLIRKRGCSVSGTVLVTRFNAPPEQRGLWNNDASRYAISFAGFHSGREIRIDFERPDVQDQKYHAVFTYRGPTPLGDAQLGIAAAKRGAPNGTPRPSITIASGRRPRPLPAGRSCTRPG